MDALRVFMFGREEAVHPRKSGFDWRVSIPSHCRAKDFDCIIAVIHGLCEHGLGGLFADWIFWEFHG